MSKVAFELADIKKIVSSNSSKEKLYIVFSVCLNTMKNGDRQEEEKKKHFMEYKNFRKTVGYLVCIGTNTLVASVGAKTENILIAMLVLIFTHKWYRLLIKGYRRNTTLN